MHRQNKGITDLTKLEAVPSAQTKEVPPKIHVTLASSQPLQVPTKKSFKTLEGLSDESSSEDSSETKLTNFMKTHGHFAHKDKEPQGCYFVTANNPSIVSPRKSPGHSHHPAGDIYE